MTFLYRFQDVCVLLFVAITLATYNWQLHPEPDKLLFAGQLVLWWFILRYVLNRFPSLVDLVCLAGVLLSGLSEAAWGLLQLYGFSDSNHSLFRLTGSFMNPGPYSGYLAVVLPVCLGVLMAVGKYNNRTLLQNVLYYISWLCLVAIVVVLPSGMSRSAWIAALISCAWVYGMSYSGRQKLKKIWKERRALFVISAVVGVLILSVAMVGVYHLKKDSADGRLLMWKITTKAIGKHPVTGVGLGSFPATYAATQADYFASGQGTATEEWVAGSPEYAFNEYLQIGLEQGLPGLAVFLLWLGCILYGTIRNRCYGVAGGILSLMIFAFSSYPIQLPEFWIVLVVLAAMGTTSYTVLPPFKKGWRGFPVTIALCIAASLVLSVLQIDRYNASKKWQVARFLYASQSYEAAEKAYSLLYPKLNHQPAYLFELAQCLAQLQQYGKANQHLERGMLLSSDPMFLYVLAKNNQTMAYYETAEELLLRAITILPERIYPHYLLVKLYAEPRFSQWDKLRVAANSVLCKEPKVHSTAIDEMRAEVEKILKNQ